MLNYLKQFSIFCLLDNHLYNLPVHSQECLAGAGDQSKWVFGPDQTPENADRFIAGEQDWIFGHLSYDLTESIFHFRSVLPGFIKFPPLFFFVPTILLKLDQEQLTIGSFEDDHELIFKEISKSVTEVYPPAKVNIRQRLEKKQYIEIIESLRKHIIRGDCYEINYCMEFYSEDARIDPFSVYEALGRISPNPFSGLYRHHDQYLICASPERYIRKDGSKIISQPIKGTSARKADAAQDSFNKEMLYQSSKDRSENVMVVDLVRNDLSRICREGTVRVEELFGVYSFPQVHQMISTISGELNPGTGFAEIIRATFPMGSMTGAPKQRVIELIEQYEKSRRGLFSGAIGYISPDKNMDFNVVIRSILYNQANAFLSLPAGSGITYYSNPEQEYIECLLKAEAMLKALTPAY